MAATSPEATEVRRRGRQRLIGAVAIVVLAVVFVPMVLDSEPRQDRKEPTLAIPPKEGAPSLPAPAAQPAPAPAKGEAPPNAAPAKTEPLMPKVAKPPPPKAPDPKVIAASEPKATPAPPQGGGRTSDAPKLEGFAVQIGAFRDEEKLRQAREKLSAAKITHFIERLPTSDLTRLRAGPYPTREAAERARASIVLSGLEGQVVPLP